MLVIGAIAAVALPVDLVWHELGRRRGARVLSGLCRVSLEPDGCGSEPAHVSLSGNRPAGTESRFEGHR